MIEKTLTDKSCFTQSWGVLGNSMGWVQLIVINSIIAVLLTLVTDSVFWHNLVFSQFIGFSIVTLLSMHVYFRKLSTPDVIAYITGIPLGSLLGIAISLFLTGTYHEYGDAAGQDKAFRSVLFSIVIGSSLAWYFLQRSNRLQERAQLAEQLAQNAEKERQLTQAQLAVLQAQIEPHFLFNTLSNVVGLIDTDSSLAKKMLESLTTYLRATLTITRQARATVRQEVELLEAYLSIFKIRMGERLQYDLTVQPVCNEMSLPPLLLQPLIENAIKHGLEPQVDGGTITTDIKLKDDFLICQIIDTGRGLNANDDNVVVTHGEGVGLSNVRERLLSLYGEQAQLSIIENSDRGVTATIRIPLSTMD